MPESRLGTFRGWIWLLAALAFTMTVGVAALAVRHVLNDPASTVEGCRSYVAKHSAVVLSEARRVAGSGSDLSYVADCESYDPGGAEGDVRDSPSMIETRMHSLGSVAVREDQGCVEYLLPEDPTANCAYFEYRPPGSEFTFEVSMPDQVEQVFAMRIKR